MGCPHTLKHLRCAYVRDTGATCIKKCYGDSPLGWFAYRVAHPGEEDDVRDVSLNHEKSTVCIRHTPNKKVAFRLTETSSGQ